MSDRLVETSISILRSLSASDMSTNKLISQTSRDKSHVEHVLKSLKKAKLIKRTRHQKYKQMIMNQLDDLGRDLSDIIYYSARFQVAFEKFCRSYIDNFLPSKGRDTNQADQVNIIEFLKRRGWNDIEIESYEDSRDEIEAIIQLCIRSIFNILIYITNQLKSSRDIGTLPMAILNNIVLKSISDQLSIMGRLIKDPDILGLWPFLDSLCADRLGVNLSHNRIIGRETRDLLGSLLNLIVVPTGERSLSEYIERYYRRYPVKPSKETTKIYDTIM